MVWREYTKRLDPDNPELDQMRVRLNIDRGQVVDFVVQHEVALRSTEEGIAYLPAVRFDATHGRAHVGFLSPAGTTIRKVWLPAELTFGEAATYAIVQTDEHWRTWRERFLRQLKEAS